MDFNIDLGYMQSVMVLKNLDLPEELEKMIFNEMTNKYHEYNQLILIDLHAKQNMYGVEEEQEEIDFYLEMPAEEYGLSDEHADEIIVNILTQLEQQGMLAYSLVDIQNMSTNPTVQRLNDLLNKDIDDPEVQD